jgi:hypothetical protein
VGRQPDEVDPKDDVLGITVEDEDEEYDDG